MIIHLEYFLKNNKNVFLAQCKNSTYVCYLSEKDLERNSKLGMCIDSEKEYKIAPAVRLI